MDRDEVLEIVKTLTDAQRKAVVWLVENQEVQTDWAWDGENSNLEDSISDTLSALASAIKGAV